MSERWEWHQWEQIVDRPGPSNSHRSPLSMCRGTFSPNIFNKVSLFGDNMIVILKCKEISHNNESSMKAQQRAQQISQGWKPSVLSPAPFRVQGRHPGEWRDEIGWATRSSNMELKNKVCACSVHLLRLQSCGARTTSLQLVMVS